MKGERSVAGLTCSEVLARRSGFVDGELPSESVEQLRQHVAGCDVCERFGDRFARIVRSLRDSVDDVADVPPDVSARLHERLRTKKIAGTGLGDRIDDLGSAERGEPVRLRPEHAVRSRDRARERFTDDEDSH